jgi:hypothetical protein
MRLARQAAVMGFFCGARGPAAQAVFAGGHQLPIALL